MISICKASAGSGKTHRLTGEYIRFLFRRPAEKEGYRHILAVTFTNKATDEMKQRILLELSRLSKDPEQSPYLEQIVRQTGQPPQRIRERAREMFSAILHDYSSFRVSTIDKFFQSVMRAFARELGRFASYNVELDTDTVITAAVDKMYADLEDDSNRELLEWLIAFSLERIDEGKTWNVRGSIENLSRQLFSEDYKEIAAGACVQRSDIARLKDRIENIVTETEQRMRDIGKRFAGALERNGLGIDDLPGKGTKGKFIIFNKLQNKFPRYGLPEPSAGFENLTEDESCWCNKGDKPAKKARISSAIGNGLMDCVRELQAACERDLPLYRTVIQVRRNLDILGIFRDVQQRIDEYCRERNIILLSETAELLDRLIDGSDTPFVYEKVGVSVDHFLLDEFQDTSRLQWKNFRPLLENSLAQGLDNLIVGDVKQSIYRWRGSDWEILNRRLAADLSDSGAEGGDPLVWDTLDTNWRSRRHIVEFNNGAFRYFSRQAQLALDGKETGVITDIYADVAQHLPPSRQEEERSGAVDIYFLEAEKHEQAVAGMLPGIIDSLIARGYESGDLAVLVRKKEEGRLVAGVLTERGYDIVSDDSLFLVSSRAVNTIIHILRQLDAPDSRTMEVAGRVSGYGRIAPEQAERLQGLSLYEMCRQIIDTVLDESCRADVAYLQKLLDVVLDYTVREGTNLPRFLKWWESMKDKLTISAPENRTSIRIMTIHKAKGLGFPVVIVPFADGKLVESHSPSKEKRIWCRCGSPELDYDGPLYVNFNRELDRTLLREDYRHERLCSFVDELNVAYVAFTRPQEELILLAPAPREKKKGKGPEEPSVSGLLYGYCREAMQDCLVEEAETAEPGTGNSAGTDAESVGDGALRAGAEAELSEAGTGSAAEGASGVRVAGHYRKGGCGRACVRPRETSRQRSVGGGFGPRAGSGEAPGMTARADSSGSDNRRAWAEIRSALHTGLPGEEPSLRDRGIAMHRIFSLIDTRADVRRAVEKAYDEGILSGGGRETVVDGYVREVEAMLDSAAGYGWFGNPHYKTLNECSILEADGSVSRPDRVLAGGDEAVVVDYKFGAFEPDSPVERSYRRQVLKYMRLLRQMGYARVRGYLWYVRAGTVTEVI